MLRKSLYRDQAKFQQLEKELVNKEENGEEEEEENEEKPKLSQAIKATRNHKLQD